MKLYVFPDSYAQVDGAITPMEDYEVITACGKVIAAGETEQYCGAVKSNSGTTAIVEVE